jgi:NDP-sugar pyrophosphorylase family protein
MSELIGVVPAAGMGTRAYPYTEAIPKVMLEVDGKPILQRNLELLRDQVEVEQVYVVVGYLSEVIRDSFGDGRSMGLRISYIQNEDVDLGLAHSIRLAGREIAPLGNPCVVLLGDSCYVGSDHAQLRTLDLGDATAACGIVETEIAALITENYSVELDGATIVRIVEKPKDPPNSWLGTGTYYLAPELFPHLERAFDESASPIDFMTFLNEQIRAGRQVRAVDLGGEYANVNSGDELSRADLLVRSREKRS